MPRLEITFKANSITESVEVSEPPRRAGDGHLNRFCNTAIVVTKRFT